MHQKKTLFFDTETTGFALFKESHKHKDQPEVVHRFLFNEDFEGAHDALSDVRATRRCYYEMVDED